MIIFDDKRACELMALFRQSFGDKVKVFVSSSTVQDLCTYDKGKKSRFRHSILSFINYVTANAFVSEAIREQ